jgi:hypothetical protein
LLPSLKIDRSDYSSFYRKSIKYQVFTKNVRWRGPGKHIQLKKTRNAKRTKNATIRYLNIEGTRIQDED